jgi:hypothetical protein
MASPGAWFKLPKPGAWSEEYVRWSKRDLSTKCYVYFWVDGIHVQARLEDAAQCLLLMVPPSLRTDVDGKQIGPEAPLRGLIF